MQLGKLGKYNFTVSCLYYLAMQSVAAICVVAAECWPPLPCWPENISLLTWQWWNISLATVETVATEQWPSVWRIRIKAACLATWWMWRLTWRDTAWHTRHSATSQLQRVGHNSTALCLSTWPRVIGKCLQQSKLMLWWIVDRKMVNCENVKF